MKKRLRKKGRFGEFTEWGRQLVISRNTKDDAVHFQDAFILHAIEANRCFCGGSMSDDTIDVIVELGMTSNDPAARWSRIIDWLRSRPDVVNWREGALFDLVHGDFKEIEKGSESAPRD